MNYVPHFNLLGIDAQQIPCSTGKGAPTTTTVGAVGCFYMNTDNGELYKCTKVENNVFDWELIEGVKGKDGLTPHIGANGNWYIGNTDTGVKAAALPEGSPVVQSIGNSETSVMSQKATTEAIAIPKEVAPRAKFRQIQWYDKDIQTNIRFEDIYVYCSGDGKFGSGAMYGLEAHGTNSTTQSVYVSRDGGDTWELYGTFDIDAPNNIWYTDIFVDAKLDVILLLKTTDGFTGSNNVLCTFLWNGVGWINTKTYFDDKQEITLVKTLELKIGKRRWLGNNNSIDVCSNADWSKRIIIFGEYQTTTDGTTYSLWKSTNSGVDWKKVLELNGDKDGKALSGDIRHWHTVQADPYTKHWWATSGDGDRQCRIYRSTDDGETWEVMFSGSQRERTCGFLFEQDCIYYGMDSTNNWDDQSIKIVKIDRAKLETDRENCREDVAVVNNAYAVYGLTRTYSPDGFIVWSQYEPGASYVKDKYVLQFYEYNTKQMYPIASFDISGMPTKYIGFYAGQRRQDIFSGNIIAKPTPSLQHEKYGYSAVSTHIKVNLTF